MIDVEVGRRGGTWCMQVEPMTFEGAADRVLMAVLQVQWEMDVLFTGLIYVGDRKYVTYMLNRSDLPDYMTQVDIEDLLRKLCLDLLERVGNS